MPAGEIRLHIVDPATNRQPIARLNSVYTEILEKRRQMYGPSVSITYPTAPKFNTAYHSNDTTALKAVSRELGLFEDKSFIVVISSNKDQSYFDRLVPKLAKFPVLCMSQAKGPHTLDIFPWHSHLAQKMLNRYLSLGLWLDRMIDLAEYYDVPVGHIEGDQPLMLSDISFARRLVQQDIVLWWSPGDQPDLGGIEHDRRPTEDLPKTDFLSAGVYSNVCLEITVRNLAVNSILQSVMVNELEGSGGATAFDSVSHTLDEYASGETQRDLTLGESQVSAQTFGIMKNMLKSWLVDKIQNMENPANLALDHFWRWITSSASHLYDQSIHRFVHGLMRKTFIQLLAEFKRLGSVVVYADFSTILLATSKPPGTAHAYATYITTAVTSHELFQHIYLNTERFYDFLVCMDRANLGGIVCEDPLALEPPEELAMEMRWNIEQFLPPAIQGDFSMIIQYFIIELYRIKQKLNLTSKTPLRVLQNDAPDATQRDAAKANEIELISEFIARRLTRKMLKMVANIHDRQREYQTLDEPSGKFSFPILPGSYLHMSNPTLEFIKFACAVFALAKDFRNEVGILKRNLLELVGVREFAGEATFRNPCEPLKLANVPCRHCDVLRDFDFCRDPELLPNNVEINPRWLCNHCGGEYDRVAIEFMLIEMTRALERNFAQQDLRCGKCQQIQSDNVSRYCQCSGSYQLTISKADMRRKLRTIVNVAREYNLPRLKVSIVVPSPYLSNVVLGMLTNLAGQLVIQQLISVDTPPRSYPP